MSEERCEPPEELRGVDGWHQLEGENGVLYCAQWLSSRDGGIWWTTGSTMGSWPESLANRGHRYLCPVPTPSDLAAAKEREAKLVEALKRIEKWFGEFPDTGRFWDEPQNTQPVSYGAQWGSNGERDFMRGVARDALDTHAPGWRDAP